MTTPFWGVETILTTQRTLFVLRNETHLFFGAFCQGMLGLNNFLPTNGDFPHSTTKVIHFYQGSRKKPSIGPKKGAHVAILTTPFWGVETILTTRRTLVVLRNETHLFFGAFCQGILGLNNFLPTNIKPLKLITFTRGAERNRV